ncbi:hypothetical protein GLOIN_2v1880406 [Rhizophagus irregularis DAOM 181602=DAOM 197198]|nr:hypothetical protein GLOIN_2v1880406 [Rhizophagus irregularis DAOM 181602=DAOM 197198]
MTTQAQVILKFSEQKKAFSIDELKRLIIAAKSMSDLDQAKRYLCSYFIPCADPHGVFWWDPDSKSLKYVIDKNIGKLIRLITKAFYIQPKQGPSQKTEFNIYKWFMVENTDVCIATCDPHKQRIFRSLTGQLYLNIFSGFLHVLRPISTFESTIHLAVKFIFSYIQDIWCSGDWNLTEYIFKWLADVSAGRKMYSILYLKSGQGRLAILRRFLEVSMGNYRTPTHYKNFMSIIVLTNENALRVENDDRRTVFLDVSPSCKGDPNYFKKLSDAMKYLGASEAFYAYLRAIADAYPDFNGNLPPMITSKYEHIISTLPPLFQFIKDTYLVVKNYMTYLPVQEFYKVYTSYCETHCISPLLKINASRILSNELAINSKLVRKDKKPTRVYSISREDLYKKFLSKNWIHEIDEIDIEEIDTETPKKLTSDLKASEKFLVKIYNSASKSQVDQEKVKLVAEKPTKEKPAPVKEKPVPVIRKALPPLPPKPDHLKERLQELREEQPDADENTNELDTDEPIDSFSDCYLSDKKPNQEQELSAEDLVPKKPSAPKPDDYDVLDDLLSDSDSTTADPVLEQQPKSPAESSAKSESLTDSKSSTEPVIVKLAPEQFIPEPDTEPEIDWDPEPKEDISDEYDWDILAFEIEECPITRVEDKYQYYLREVVNRFKDWIKYNGNLPKTPSRKELADIIRIYKENRDAKIIPTPSGYETLRTDKGKAREIPEERPKTKMEH